MQNIKRQSTERQRYAFYGLCLIGAFGVLRNFGRMSRKASEYTKFKQVVMRRLDSNQIVSILQGENLQQQTILQILPNFKERYFQSVDDSKNYKSLKGDFYESLKLQHSFEGFLSNKKKEYRIQFYMNHSNVSIQLVNLVKSLEQKGTRFNKNQPIMAYGTLKYLKQKKKPVFDTKMVSLSGLSMVKYFQIHILSITLSTFFFSTLLGIAIAMYLNVSVIDEKALEQWISNSFQFFPQSQIQEAHLDDNLPL